MTLQYKHVWGQTTYQGTRYNTTRRVGILAVHIEGGDWHSRFVTHDSLHYALYTYTRYVRSSSYHATAPIYQEIFTRGSKLIA